MEIDDKSLEKTTRGGSIFDLIPHEPRENCKHFEQTSIMFGKCKIYQSEDTLSAAELV